MGSKQPGNEYYENGGYFRDTKALIRQNWHQIENIEYRIV